MQSDKRGSISSTLLESVKASQPEAWRRLVDLYGQVVYRWCRKSGLKAEDAADAVQEVFTAVAMHVADFKRQRPGDSFTAWLSVITRNKIRDHFRHSEGRPQAPGGTRAQERIQEIPQIEQSTGPEGSPEGDSPIFAALGGTGVSPVLPEKNTGKMPVPPFDDLMEAEKILSRRAVELVRAEFEPRTWDAWYKTAVDGRPAADVAAELGMTLAAVYKAKSRILLRLRQELAGLQGDTTN